MTVLQLSLWAQGSVLEEKNNNNEGGEHVVFAT